MIFLVGFPAYLACGNTNLHFMPITTSFNKEQGFLEINYSGHVSKEDLFDSLRTSSLLIQNNQCHRVLANCSELTGGHTIVDLATLISGVDDSNISKQLREAVLVPDDQKLIYLTEFYELNARTKGYNIQMFRDRQVALVWLLS